MLSVRDFGLLDKVRDPLKAYTWVTGALHPQSKWSLNALLSVSMHCDHSGSFQLLHGVIL